METFFNQNIFCHENDSNTANLFETYTPSFINPEFYMEPPMFGNMETDNSCTTEFFSSILTNNAEQTFSRTSKTVINNGKITTTTKNVFQNGTNLYQTEKTKEFANNGINYNQSYGKVFFSNS